MSQGGWKYRLLSYEGKMSGGRGKGGGGKCKGKRITYLGKMKVKLNIYKVKKVERVRDRLSRRGEKYLLLFLGGGGSRAKHVFQSNI
jgi:hypothetical protein